MAQQPSRLDIKSYHHPFLDKLGQGVTLSTRAYAKNDPVFCHGDAAKYLYLVADGWVKLSRQTPDGKEIITGLCAPGDIFGEASLFPNAQYPAYAEALVDHTQLVLIASEHVRAHAAAEATFSQQLMQLLGERGAEAELKLDQLSTMSASQRLGCFILRLCDKAETTSDVKIPIEKHVLASYLGMKPETFSRTLQQLKEQGVLAKGQHISVSSIDALRRFVCGSCAASGDCATEDRLME